MAAGITPQIAAARRVGVSRIGPTLPVRVKVNRSVGGDDGDASATARALDP
jgi:hypothetical protein